MEEEAGLLPKNDEPAGIKNKRSSYFLSVGAFEAVVVKNI